MPDVKFVIGANYGDEGKGLVSANLAAKAQQDGKKCLTILYNGGPQRGHTVEFGNFRHIYHHFAAGSEFGSDTYFHQDFLVNPMTYVQEYGNIFCEIYMDARSRVVTPFDMIANQFAEQGRDVRHGSCGMGIFETIARYNDGDDDDDGIITRKVGNLYGLGNSVLYKYISDVQRYYEHKKGIRFDSIPGLDIEGLKQHWVDDFNAMIDDVSSIVYDWSVKSLLNHYDVIIFEGGQGLALDMDNMADFPHLTPSNTGCKKMIPFIIGTLGEDTPIELYYVTRSYLTRHGNGPMPDGYLDHSMIKQDMTNHPNPWQGTLRLAGFTSKSIASMMGRICKDKRETYSMNNVVCNLVITHTNEIAEIEIPADIFDNIFYSKSKNCTSLIKNNI
jgi:adenylosuccinate synthase